MSDTCRYCGAEIHHHVGYLWLAEPGKVETRWCWEPEADRETDLPRGHHRPAETARQR